MLTRAHRHCRSNRGNIRDNKAPSGLGAADGAFTFEQLAVIFVRCGSLCPYSNRYARPILNLDSGPQSTFPDVLNQGNPRPGEQFTVNLKFGNFFESLRLRPDPVLADAAGEREGRNRVVASAEVVLT